ncbi:hypothetical protein [Nonomuraea maheshkhaliensis]
MDELSEAERASVVIRAARFIMILQAAVLLVNLPYAVLYIPSFANPVAWPYPPKVVVALLPPAATRWFDR